MEKRCDVAVHDPYVSEYPGITILSDMRDAVHGADAVIVFAGHKQYRGLDPVQIKKLTGKEHPVIVDGRNMIDPDLFIKNGFIYRGIGRGDKNRHTVVRP
jgi:UDP-N-acetyl-D-mannosaminuronic acid dehydrogenase